VNITLTLVVQMFVFAVLIWFTARFVWPLITNVMEERSRRIALGLAGAEKGQQGLAPAHARAARLLLAGSRRSAVAPPRSPGHPLPPPPAPASRAQRRAMPAPCGHPRRPGEFSLGDALVRIKQLV